MNQDSGTWRGKRMIRGGRTDVRTALYMPALVASRHNPQIRAFYQRLRKEGKAAKVALTASGGSTARARRRTFTGSGPP